MKKNSPLNIVFSMIILSIFLPSVLAASWKDLQITRNTQEDARIDIALDSNDVLHRVYEREGYIYYSKGLDKEEKVVQGTNPSIALDSANHPYIIYFDGNFLAYTKKIESWSTPAYIAKADTADIAVDKKNHIHIAFQSGALLYYATDKESSLKTALLADLHTATSQPNIKVTPDGYYYILYGARSWGDQCSFSADYLILTTNDPHSVGASTSRDLFEDCSGGPVAHKNSLALENGKAYIIFSVNEDLFYATSTQGIWTEAKIDSGKNPSIAVNNDAVALTYEKNGYIHYNSNSGAGFSGSEQLSSGNHPTIALGSKYIDYIGSDGDPEIFEITDRYNSIMCQDTDGQDAFTQGTVFTTTEPFSDVCLDGQTLMEYICSDLKPIGITMHCAGGCENGACIQPEPSREIPEFTGIAAIIAVTLSGCILFMMRKR